LAAAMFANLKMRDITSCRKYMKSAEYKNDCGTDLDITKPVALFSKTVKEVNVTRYYVYDR
jgi:hypothetical protein